MYLRSIKTKIEKILNVKRNSLSGLFDKTRTLK